VGSLGLCDDRPERPDGLGIVLTGQKELRPAEDHRQRVIQLVAGPGGELGQGFEHRPPARGFLAVDPAAMGGDRFVQQLPQAGSLLDRPGPRIPGVQGRRRLGIDRRVGKVSEMDGRREGSPSLSAAEREAPAVVESRALPPSHSTRTAPMPGSPRKARLARSAQSSGLSVGEDSATARMNRSRWS